MIDFNHFLSRPEFSLWRNHFEHALEKRASPARHGDLPTWLNTLQSLPQVPPSAVELNSDTIIIGKPEDLNPEQQHSLHQGLLALAPWRKGPYQFFDTFIDTEWRSDWKWQRLKPHVSDLTSRKILDVGCGTGYHCWRMLGDNAQYVLGIDPSMRFLVQYLSVQRYLNDSRFNYLPIGIEDMPQNMPLFDSVFSMGVLYHRRNPINHLIELKNLMREGGEVILETLIIDHADNGLLQPSDRYAMMRNVWSIMTVEKIIDLLQQAGFSNIRCVDQDTTSLHEQRTTDWMTFHSLQQFLDPDDISKTLEGYPAPKRGIFIANKPS